MAHAAVDHGVERILDIADGRKPCAQAFAEGVAARVGTQPDDLGKLFSDTEDRRQGVAAASSRTAPAARQRNISA